MVRLLIPLALLACTGQGAPSETAPPETEPPAFDVADVLLTYLEGDFDSSAQSERDLAYHNIQLLACEVDAPELGERVLYVEQAFADNTGAPYRQRLYVVTADADDPWVGLTEVYTLADEGQLVGLCGRERRRTFGTADVSLRAGCGVRVTYNEADATFDGGTVGTDCMTSGSDDAYTTSEVRLTETQIDSWDRGFDDAGTQVWGAEAGPYEFVRRIP